MQTVFEGGNTMLIDVHAHCRGPIDGADDPWGQDRELVERMKAGGIDIAVVSNLSTPRPSTVEGFQKCNRDMLAALKEFRGFYWGWAYVNPGYALEAIADIDRCLEADEDCIGVKLYNEYHICDPAARQVLGHCEKHDIPILLHAGHSHVNRAAQPNISDAGHIVKASREFPEAKIICGHIGGGGDWEWEIKTLRDASPATAADISGSVTDEGLVEYSIRHIGADRLFFATDNQVHTGVGKFRSAKMSDEDREKIASKNFLRYIGRDA
jgi:predicted TIM-barrel fold metal-dependent hydrolase